MSLGRRHLVAGATAALMPLKAWAEPPDVVRFSTEFRIYGGTAAFPYGVDRGFFREQNIICTVDPAVGSGESVKRVATGLYDFASADASTLVEFASRNGDLSPKIIMPLCDTNAACIVSLKSKPVLGVKDLEGATVGISANDSGARILPVLLRQYQADGRKINFKMVDAQLRDTLLVRRDVDAVIGFDYTALFDLIGVGVPAEDVNLVHFAAIGFEFYSASLIAPRRWIDQKPDLVRRVAVAVAKSWVAASQDVDGAIASVLRREPLTDVKLERARLRYILNEHVKTDFVRKNGFGTMDPTRLNRGLAIIAEGFQIPVVPAGEVYDDRFLPDLADRRI